MQRVIGVMLALLILANRAFAEDRVERFPAPDFRSGYTMPVTQTPPTPSGVWQAVDVVALTVALSLAAWLVFTKRSRKWVVGLTIASVIYFGFWRKGCICPVGSIQNVAYAAGGHGYALPWAVAAFFLLPLLFSLFYGRVFCAGVCPLGAVQDLVLLKPLRLPAWLETPLALLAWAYLGLAVLFAAIGSDFVICRYDPFVGFFRLSGPAHMIIAGGVILAISVFIGRPYCRFLCPYSIPLRLLSPCSKNRVSITPTHCIHCRLCETSCPFGAIRYPSPRQLRPMTAERQLRRVLAGTVALVGLTGVFAAAGYMSSGAFARVDPTVRLAELVQAEEHAGQKGLTDPTRAFRNTGRSVSDLYAEATAVQRRFAIGTPVFGAWMGLAIGGSLLGRLRTRRRPDYTADPAGCLACARCFAACPAEVRVPEQELVLVNL